MRQALPPEQAAWGGTNPAGEAAGTAPPGPRRAEKPSFVRETTGRMVCTRKMRKASGSNRGTKKAGRSPPLAQTLTLMRREDYFFTSV